MKVFAPRTVLLSPLLSAGAAALMMVATLPSCAKTDPPRGAPVTAPGPIGDAAVYPSATQAELNWLAPLAPGVRARGFVILAVSRVDQGTVWLSFQKDQIVTTLQVNTLAATPVPVAKTDQFAIYFASGSDTYGAELAALVAEALTKNARVPAPPGLLPFDAAQRAPDLPDGGPQPRRPN